MQDFRNLSVWRAARQLAAAVYRLTRTLPLDEKFGLQAQMRREDREFRRFLQVAMGSVCELECELLLCVDLALISESQQREPLETLIAVKRMLGGLLRQLSAEKP